MRGRRRRARLLPGRVLEGRHPQIDHGTTAARGCSSSPRRAPPGRAPPGRAAPGRTAPGRAAPGRTAPGRALGRRPSLRWLPSLLLAAAAVRVLAPRLAAWPALRRPALLRRLFPRLAARWRTARPLPIAPRSLAAHPASTRAIVVPPAIVKPSAAVIEASALLAGGRGSTPTLRHTTPPAPLGRPPPDLLNQSIEWDTRNLRWLLRRRHVFLLLSPVKGPRGRLVLLGWEPCAAARTRRLGRRAATLTSAVRPPTLWGTAVVAAVLVGSAAASAAVAVVQVEIVVPIALVRRAVPRVTEHSAIGSPPAIWRPAPAIWRPAPANAWRPAPHPTRLPAVRVLAPGVIAHEVFEGLGAGPLDEILHHAEHVTRHIDPLVQNLTAGIESVPAAAAPAAPHRPVVVHVLVLVIEGVVLVEALPPLHPRRRLLPRRRRTTTPRWRAYLTRRRPTTPVILVVFIIHYIRLVIIPVARRRLATGRRRALRASLLGRRPTTAPGGLVVVPVHGRAVDEARTGRDLHGATGTPW